MLGGAMAQKRPFRAFFWARPPARQAVRVGVVPVWRRGRPRLPIPAAPFARFARRGAATLGSFAPAGLKPLTIGIGSRRRRRRHAARCARFAARPSPGPSGRAAGPPAAAFRRIPSANMWLGWPDRRDRATTGKVGGVGIAPFWTGIPAHALAIPCGTPRSYRSCRISLSWGSVSR